MPNSDSMPSATQTLNIAVKDNLDALNKLLAKKPSYLKAHATFQLSFSDNTLPHWLMALTGMYVSMLNDAQICVNHYYNQLVEAIGNAEKAHNIRLSLEANHPEHTMGEEVMFITKYCRMLTLYPQDMEPSILEELSLLGFNDSMIVELNQMVAYFNLINRSIIGLNIK